MSAWKQLTLISSRSVSWFGKVIKKESLSKFPSKLPQKGRRDYFPFLFF